MDKAKQLKTTTAIVKHILLTVPETRNSDMLLYYRVCDAINKNALNSSFGYVLLSMQELKLPAFETVRRCRQKAQQLFPELCGKTKVKEQRQTNEQIYRDYARKENIQ